MVEPGSSQSDLNNASELPRENLINTAVKFLQNPKVVSSADSQKRAFLKNKGLTDQEVDLAIQRSGVPVNNSDNDAAPTRVAPIPGVYQGQGSPQMALVAPVSSWSRVREYLSTAMLLGGVVYGLYYVYKKYLVPYLYGAKKSKLDLLEESVAELKKNGEAALQCLRELQQQTSVITPSRSIPPEDTYQVADKDKQQYVEIKNEIKSLKALLLTPRQFPQAPVTRPLIPDWQLNATITPSSSSSKLAATTSVSVALDTTPVSSADEGGASRVADNESPSQHTTDVALATGSGQTDEDNGISLGDKLSGSAETTRTDISEHESNVEL